MSRVFLFCIALSVLGSGFAQKCTSPKATVTSFSTEDATILTMVAHVAEFSLSCAEKEIPNLFAEFPCGKLVPVAHIGDSKYQLSWTQEIQKSTRGDVNVRLYDEEGYANVRKALRDGKTSSVKSLIDITVSTKGVYKGPWIKVELIAAALITGIAYFAFNNKSKVQS